MKSHPFILIAPLAFVALLGVACDGGEAAEPTSTATVVATAPSTPTATPEATSTGTNEPARIALVGGIITYVEKIALPADAVIKVRLVDVSLQDVAAVTLAETVFQADNRQVPFEYSMQYDLNDIAPNGTYAIQAEIWIGSELWFTTDTHVPAITPDAQPNPEIVLVRVLG